MIRRLFTAASALLNASLPYVAARRVDDLESLLDCVRPSYFSVTATLLPLAALVSGCTSNVSANPKYQHGWVPGREYELKCPMALVQDKRTGWVHFEPNKEDQPVGTVLGWSSGYEQVLVQHAPANTRLRVEKLLRGANPIMTVTVPEGRILSGPYRGTVVELYSVSRHDRVAEQEIVDRRGDDWVAPVP